MEGIAALFMMRTPSFATLAVILSSLAAVNSISLDCEKVVVDGVTFNLKSLGGPHSIFELYDTGSRIRNTTFTIDVCAPLEKVTDKHCANGARICAFERFYEHDAKADAQEPGVAESWSIAGEFIHENRHLDTTLTRLKGSDSHADSEKEGVRMELNGGEREKTKQKAFVEFVCDQSKSGVEGLTVKNMRRADGNDSETQPLPDPNAGKALQLVSYREDKLGKEEEITGVLRMEWKTKYACEQVKNPDKEKDTTPGTTTPPKRGWGFFTWMIIIVFLGVAAYLIFGSWLNYSRYGARGLDMLPHGDSIRDIPYLMREWARRVLGTLQGRGNGRGYSAI